MMTRIELNNKMTKSTFNSHFPTYSKHVSRRKKTNVITQSLYRKSGSHVHSEFNINLKRSQHNSGGPSAKVYDLLKDQQLIVQINTK